MECFISKVQKTLPFFSSWFYGIGGAISKIIHLLIFEEDKLIAVLPNRVETVYFHQGLTYGELFIISKRNWILDVFFSCFIILNRNGIENADKNDTVYLLYWTFRRNSVAVFFSTSVIDKAGFKLLQLLIKHIIWCFKLNLFSDGYLFSCISIIPFDGYFFKEEVDLGIYCLISPFRFSFAPRLDSWVAKWSQL
jgi:hypothetical protein